MKRYNQGFGKFGMMEHCNDGKWVKYEEAETELEIEKEISYNRLVNEYLAESRSLDYMLLCAMLGAISIIEFILLVFK